MPNRKGNVTNPTGKGGFGDNPQNQANGRWKKENSQSYCLNMFLHMTESELLEWEKDNPKSKRTVAQALAYARVLQAQKDLANYREVVDRTEGRPVQKSELQANVKSSGLSPESLQTLETMYARNNKKDSE